MAEHKHMHHPDRGHRKMSMGGWEASREAMAKMSGKAPAKKSWQKKAWKMMKKEGIPFKGEKRKRGKVAFTKAVSSKFGAKAKPFAARKMLTAKRHISTSGRINKLGYSSGHSDMMIKPFGWHPKNAGTMIKRIYETQIQQTNTANTNDAFGYSFRVMNTAGALSLEMWTGTPGVGTLLSTFADFPLEAAHYFDVFRWMKATGIQIEVVPIVNQVDLSASDVVDQTAEADAGLVKWTAWDGDQDLVSAAGVVQTDWTEFSRYKTKSFDPIGKKILMMAKIPQVWVSITPNGTGALSAPQWSYPAAPAWDTVVARTANQQYPFYGFKYFWQHNGLSTNGGKCKFLLRVKVEIQWNTLFDADIAAAKQARIAADIAARTGSAADTVIDMSDEKTFVTVDKPALKRQKVQQTSGPPPSPTTALLSRLSIKK